MSAETERLESELHLAKLSEKLEDARAAFHKNRGDSKVIKAFKKASQALADARQEHRAKYRPVVAEGDAVAEPETVKVKGKASSGGAS